MEIVIGVAGKGERRETRFLDDDAKLLLQLADQRRFGRLARFDLAAGEFPQASHRSSSRTLGDENAPVRIDEGARGNEDELDAHDLVPGLTARSGSAAIVAIDRHVVLGEIAGQHAVAATAEAERDL